MVDIIKQLKRRPRRQLRPTATRRKYTLTSDTHNKIKAAAQAAGCYTSNVIEFLVDKHLPDAPARKTRKKPVEQPEGPISSDDFGL